MRNKTIYEQSEGLNIISTQFIGWKSHKQSWPAKNDNRGESEVMVTRPIRWEEPLQNCIENKGRRINKYLTAIMTLPFGGAHGSLTAITHTKINTKIAPAKKCNFQHLTVNT